jgi:hypothetical protein
MKLKMDESMRRTASHFAILTLPFFIYYALEVI